MVNDSMKYIILKVYDKEFLLFYFSRSVNCVIYQLDNTKAKLTSIYVNIMTIMEYKNLVEKVRYNPEIGFVRKKKKRNIDFVFSCLGISLTVDQWEKLKTLVDQVDKELKKSK